MRVEEVLSREGALCGLHALALLSWRFSLFLEMPSVMAINFPVPIVISGHGHSL